MVKEFDPLYTVKEAADLLKISTRIMYEIIDNGEIPCLILGRKKIRGRDLEAYINSLEAIKIDT